MKAKDLTQADVGKWVTVKVKITEADDGLYPVGVDFDENLNLWLAADTIVEFTTPPAPVQEVGDVFWMVNNGMCEWTISAIVDNACLLTHDGGHISWDYPLSSNDWTPIK
jgi:hypothetical protein